MGGAVSIMKDKEVDIQQWGWTVTESLSPLLSYGKGERRECRY